MPNSALRTFALSASLCVFALQALADITPAVPFQSHAVLQQGRALPVWGTADAGEKVTVTYTAGTTTRTASATAGADGRWSAELPALAASAESATLTFNGKNTVTLTDILVGEVWLASGQSNMEFALAWGRIANAKEEIADADHPLIRELKIKPAAADTPQDTAPGNWRVCSPSTVGNFSGAAYFFARDLQQKLNMPVGIINASWGGSAIEPFMTPDSLAADANGTPIIEAWKTKTADYPARKARYDEDLTAWRAAKLTAEKAGEKFTQKAPGLPPGPGHQATPSGSYNAMIYPVVPYAIRGVIWYQGETNAGRHAEYRTFFPSLITGWREVFHQPDMPFYWVQLAAYGANGDPDGAGFPWLRDAQDRTLSLPHTGQALAIDIGDADNIHPANKVDVGHRLARLAFHRTYGFKDVIDSGPTFAKVELNAGTPVKIHITFENIAAGLKNTNPAEPDAVLGFDVAGADKNFRAATAIIENAATGLVLITTPDTVPSPLYVRYAWHNYPANTLANSEGLPAAPFHTDP